MNVSNRPARSGIIASSILVGLSFSRPALPDDARPFGPLPPALSAGFAGQRLNSQDRLQLLKGIEQAAGELESVKDDAAKLALAQRIQLELGRYKESLGRDDHADKEELEAAQSLAIYKLNVASFRNALPAILGDPFIAEHVLGLHASLVDFLQNPGCGVSGDLRRTAVEALLRDMLWSESYGSETINRAAADRFSERLFRVPDDRCKERLVFGRACLAAYGRFRTSKPLFEAALSTMTRTGLAHDREALSFLGELLLSFEASPPQVEKLCELTRAEFYRPESRELLQECLGPVLGELILKRAGTQEVSKVIEELLCGEKPDSRRRADSECVPPFVRGVLIHAFQGREDPEYWGKVRLRDMRDLEERGARRVSCGILVLAMLRGFDRIVPEASADSTPASDVKAGPADALKKVREQARSELNLILLEAPTDEQRATVLAALIESDERRFSSLQAASDYAERRLREMGKFFPSIELANDPGRYSTKVKEIRYYPPVQVSGDPAPYVDLYFYTREALAPRTKEAGSLARDFAKASQTVFLTEFMLTLIGDKPELRPVEFHRALSDRAMQDEASRMLSVFGCYKDDPMLRLRLISGAPEDFVGRIKALRTEALTARRTLRSEIEGILHPLEPTHVVDVPRP